MPCDRRNLSVHELTLTLVKRVGEFSDFHADISCHAAPICALKDFTISNIPQRGQRVKHGICSQFEPQPMLRGLKSFHMSPQPIGGKEIAAVSCSPVSFAREGETTEVSSHLEGDRTLVHLEARVGPPMSLPRWSDEPALSGAWTTASARQRD